MTNGAHSEPVRLGLESQFKFRCHKDVSCFTRCWGISIILTPYDIILLKKKLDLRLQASSWPCIRFPNCLKKPICSVLLKLLDDESRSCPFVRDDGCLVYKNSHHFRYYPSAWPLSATRKAPTMTV